MLQHSRWIGAGSSRNAVAPCRRAAAAARVATRCQAHNQEQQQQQQQQEVRRPIEVSRSIAAARAAESSRPDRLFGDPWAASLCGMQPPQAVTAPATPAAAASDQGQPEQAGEAAVAAAMDVIATRYIDESLEAAMAATSVNTIQGGDYRQIVLLGDGMDSRPFRLAWPPGTLLFAVAPPEVHERAEALLATGQPPAHVQRGCLLRRVNMNLSAASSSSSAREQQAPPVPAPSIFRSALLAAGFRPDRLSVWVLQGLHGQGLGRPALQQLLAEVGNCAAFHSLLVGEVPGPLGRRDADNLLAEAGLLAAVTGHGQADAGEYKRWQELGPAAAAAGADGDEGSAERWLCTAQQQRLSLEQMGIYDEWSAEFESSDAGDDFIGNFT